MTTKAFVRGCRGADDEPECTNPLSWLKSAIAGLEDLPKLLEESVTDPDAHGMMIMHLCDLHRRLTEACVAADADQRRPRLMAAMAPICHGVGGYGEPSAR